MIDRQMIINADRHLDKYRCLFITEICISKANDVISISLYISKVERSKGKNPNLIFNLKY